LSGATREGGVVGHGRAEPGCFGRRRSWSTDGGRRQNALRGPNGRPWPSSKMRRSAGSDPGAPFAPAQCRSLHLTIRSDRQRLCHVLVATSIVFFTMSSSVREALNRRRSNFCPMRSFWGRSKTRRTFSWTDFHPQLFIGAKPAGTRCRSRKLLQF